MKKSKDATIRVRVTRDQRKRFKSAAQREGLDLSAWLRTVGLKATAPSVEAQQG